MICFELFSFLTYNKYVNLNREVNIMKKIFILLALFLMFGLLVGCASKPAQNVSKDQFYFSKLYETVIDVNDIDSIFEDLNYAYTFTDREIDNFYHYEGENNDFTMTIKNETEVTQYLDINYNGNFDDDIIIGIPSKETYSFSVLLENIALLHIKRMTYESAKSSNRHVTYDWEKKCEVPKDFNHLTPNDFYTGQPRKLEYVGADTILFIHEFPNKKDDLFSYFIREIIKSHTLEYSISEAQITYEFEKYRGQNPNTRINSFTVHECKFIKK